MGAYKDQFLSKQSGESAVVFIEGKPWKNPCKLLVLATQKKSVTFLVSTCYPQATHAQDI
jgi:hypothetical protein